MYPNVFAACTAILLILSGVRGQADTLSTHYAKSITEAELKTHLTILASDEYQGRETGKVGQKMAMAYLKAEFQKMGIPPVPKGVSGVITEGYYQPFSLVEERSGSIGITSGARELKFMKELLYFNESLTQDRTVDRVVWMGDGSDFSSMKNARNSVALVHLPKAVEMNRAMGRMRSISEAAEKMGVAILLFATDDMPAFVEEFGHYVNGGRMRLSDGANGKEKKRGIQTMMIDAGSIDALLGKKDLSALTGKRSGRKVRTDFTITRSTTEENLVSENVLAYIEGTDKKDELVVITAHYDHIGVENGVVYNGADDDGTGTVALLEIAEAFAKAKADGHGPRRSILVMPVSGEEKGLLGSRYYSDHPVFPLANTVADLNIDMIGRTDSSHASSAPYVYVIGSDRLSSDLHAVNEVANTNYAKLDLDYTFNDEDDPNRFYYRSDHYNFARKGVPSIFYFSGVHEDYHQPGDDVEKIRFDLLRQRTLLVFHTAWSLAFREDRPVVDKPIR